MTDVRAPRNEFARSAPGGAGPRRVVTLYHSVPQSFGHNDFGHAGPAGQNLTWVQSRPARDGVVHRAFRSACG